MTRSARIVWIVTILYWCLLFAATHLPGPRLPPIPVTDKTAHQISYFLLGVCLFSTLHLRRRRVPSQIAVIVLGTLLAYGAIDEWTQIPVHRSCEMADWNADAAGTGVSVLLCTLVITWRESRRSPTGPRRGFEVIPKDADDC